MAIDFVHYHDTDLAIHTWTDAFDLNAMLRATRAYLLTPAKFEVLDIRRLNLDTISSMDLFKLAEHLRAAYRSDRHIPGKTAIVYQEDGPPIYSSSQRLFHSFSIWAKEHRLPREFALFPSVDEAVAWLGSREISTDFTEALSSDALEDDPDQALSA